MREAPLNARRKPMTSIGWLQLADLHQTLRRPGWQSEMVRREVEADLEQLHKQTGPWDLVIVAGDLSMRGSPEELDEAERVLDGLLDHLRSLGSNPELLAVPGNHDVARAHGPAAGLQALRRWSASPHIQQEFWTDLESPGRRLVDRALDPFERWWNRRLQRGFGKPVSRFRAGLLPGDFTATASTPDISVGIAGLCSAFLQVTGDDYEGRLSLSHHQATVAAGGDLPAWVARHDAAILLTHHSPAWLTSEDRRAYEEYIAPLGRFAAHLSAHHHEQGPLIEASDRPQIRCPSFFGLDFWEDRRGRPGLRRFGYNVTRLFIEGPESRIEVRPRLWTKSGISAATRLADVDEEGRVVIPVRPFPRTNRDCEVRLEHAALRDALSALYPAPEDPRRLAREAGMMPIPSKKGGAAADLWHVVVSEADRRDALGDLIRVVAREYPDAARVQQAWNAVQRASRQGEDWAPEVRYHQANESEGDALYERLGELHPAAFEAVLNLLSLQDSVPSDAPQNTRAMALVRWLERRDGPKGLQRLANAIERAAAPRRSAEDSATLGPSDEVLHRGGGATVITVGSAAGNALMASGMADPAAPLLDQDILARVQRAALSLGLGRHALLAGIPQPFVASLPARHSPAAQVLADLEALNRTAPLADGTTPLATWLTNALAHAGDRPERQIFLKAREIARSGERPRRAPTYETLGELLTLMFPDERDLDGFVLDHYPPVYRRFSRGMGQAQRISLLLHAVDPTDLVNRLKRSQPSAFRAHERVLDYEESGDALSRRHRGR